MGEELSLINWVRRLFAFGLDYDSTFDDHVGSKSAIELYAVVDERHCFLSFYLHAQLSKFVRETRLVR